MATKIDFSWDADDNTEFYQLFEDGELIANNIYTPEFSLLMTNITQGLHSYQVRGVSEFGEGLMSDPLEINYLLPGKPMNLRYVIA